MENFVLVLHIFIAFALIAIVMMQRSEGGGTGFGGSSPSMMGLSSARGKANFLTKMTTYLAIGFFLTSLALAVMGSHKSEDASLIDQMNHQANKAKEAPATNKKAEPAVPIAE